MGHAAQNAQSLGLNGDAENFVGLGVKRQPLRGGVDDIMDGSGRVADSVGIVEQLYDLDNGCNMKGYNKPSKFNDFIVNSVNDAAKCQFLKRHEEFLVRSGTVRHRARRRNCNL